jgi:hypothetical protein
MTSIIRPWRSNATVTHTPHHETSNGHVRTCDMKRRMRRVTHPEQAGFATLVPDTNRLALALARCALPRDSLCVADDCCRRSSHRFAFGLARGVRAVPLLGTIRAGLGEALWNALPMVRVSAAVTTVQVLLLNALFQVAAPGALVGVAVGGVRCVEHEGAHMSQVVTRCVDKDVAELVRVDRPTSVVALITLLRTEVPMRAFKYRHTPTDSQRSQSSEQGVRWERCVVICSTHRSAHMGAPRSTIYAVSRRR